MLKMLYKTSFNRFNYLLNVIFMQSHKSIWSNFSAEAEAK